MPRAERPGTGAWGQEKGAQVNLTRKQFFRQGLLSLGSAAADAAALLRGEAPAGGAAEPEGTPPDAGAGVVACGRDDLCLARSCGCFSCIERCPCEAISMLIGKGIVVDAERCAGCGTCASVCPTAPKAVELKRRT
jgi:heterodisulfide reductase subunit A-like polyferredoxin